MSNPHQTGYSENPVSVCSSPGAYEPTDAYLSITEKPIKLPKDSNGCPYLQLAPMEGVGDACFRKAIASIGGFDEAVRDFLRVPANAHVKSLSKVYFEQIEFQPRFLS